jgi:hypothetical protein
MKQLPPWLESLIANPPDAGNGFHSWLFSVARNLHPHLTERELYELLREKANSCGRYVPDKEILDAIRNSKGAAWVPKGTQASLGQINPASTLLYTKASQATQGGLK